MKHINKIILAAGLTIGFWGCSGPEIPSANVSTTASTFVANFRFVNATPDAPALSFFINNIKTGSDTGSDVNYSQGSYTPIFLTSAGLAGTLTANTNIRVKAVSGGIGGTLESNDLIYRAGNTNSNNFVAINGNNYTVFAIDSIKREKPLRKLNSGNFGDVTWYNPKTNPGTQISIVEKVALTLSDPAAAANLVSLGVVPLGSSDVGGVRLYVTQDVIPVLTSPATQAGIRFVNAVPNANATPGNPTLFVRLRPAAGATISLSAGTTHVMNVASFNPSVGTRTAGSVTFPAQTIAAAGVSIAYTLEASTNAGYTPILYSVPNVTFTSGKVYTVFMRGMVGKTGSIGLSHGIITHN